MSCPAVTLQSSRVVRAIDPLSSLTLDGWQMAARDVNEFNNLDDNLTGVEDIAAGMFHPAHAATFWEAPSSSLGAAASLTAFF